MYSLIERPKYGSEQQPFTVLIEGNIGSGKTTFLKHFKKFENSMCLITEPVEKWRNFNDFNLLGAFYKDPIQWTFPFQTYVILTIINQHLQQTTKKVKLMERSIFSSRYCFVENLSNNNVLEKATYDILQECYKHIDNTIHIQADLIIYLRTSPDVAHERILKRARTEEDKVSIEYLKQLHDLHEDWLIHNKYKMTTPVLILDGDLDADSMMNEYQRAEDEIAKLK